MVPEDRKLQGVVVDHAIGENVLYSNLDKVARNGWITTASARAFAREAIAKFGVKGTAQQPASSLSGGNQQKVVIAKWLARDPRVVILDEPTRGIDVGARSGIYDIIAGLAKEGVAVIVVSSDLEEVLGVSNRSWSSPRASRRASSTGPKRTTSPSWNSRRSDARSGEHRRPSRPVSKQTPGTTTCRTSP